MLVSACITKHMTGEFKRSMHGQWSTSLLVMHLYACFGHLGTTVEVPGWVFLLMKPAVSYQAAQFETCGASEGGHAQQCAIGLAVMHLQECLQHHCQGHKVGKVFSEVRHECTGSQASVCGPVDADVDADFDIVIISSVAHGSSLDDGYACMIQNFEDLQERGLRRHSGFDGKGMHRWPRKLASILPANECETFEMPKGMPSRNADVAD